MLLTPARIEAAARICRFNGWTNRHYSILEHMVIGANVLREMGAVAEVQKAFLVHDLEETEFTDMITPHKREFMKPNYYLAVEIWERDMCNEVNLPYKMLQHVDVKAMDKVMLSVESHTVSATDWRGFCGDCPEADVTNRMIASKEYKGKHAVKAFHRLMRDLS